MATEREARLIMEARASGITTQKEMANFMAQVTQESLGLTRLEESFRYTHGISQIPKPQLRADHPVELEAARLEAVAGRPEPLAELMYGGGQMGNTEPGDGYKYRGRGFIQLTGKDNYRAAGEALGLDLVNNPDLAAKEENAGKVATWFWNENIHHVAPENVDKATHIVNKGNEGLTNRRMYFEQWKEKLTPEIMEGLARNEMLLPIEATPTHQGHSAAHSAVAGLRLGANGAEVTALQTQLSQLGYKGVGGRDIQPDGDFGASTKVAVESFQRDHGLGVDGVAGDNTLAALRGVNPQQANATPAQAVPLRLDHPDHPGFPMFQQARAGVHQLDAEQGRVPDKLSENIAGALTASAKYQGLNRIDAVALSDDGAHVWAAQHIIPGALNATASVPTAQAVNTPLERSTEVFQQAAQTQTQTQQMQQQQTQQVQQGQQEQAGPSITHQR
ncbi:XVIPCD domain-containing protein [Dyella silvatica]|uniref:XVIPCD domain-containing protein n=1 Tax=Dyella silvatica TaxID=2992128 RepID=UPI0022511CFF|nr:XVIPCD domain-containing protein [Dyella silvatica]